MPIPVLHTLRLRPRQNPVTDLPKRTHRTGHPHTPQRLPSDLPSHVPSLTMSPSHLLQLVVLDKHLLSLFLASDTI